MELDLLEEIWLNFFKKKFLSNRNKIYFKKYNIPKLKWIKIDLKNFKQIKKKIKNFDIVIQAAATTSGANIIINKPYHHVTDNAVMNSYLLRAIFQNKIDKFIFLSCSVMYPSRKIKQTEKDGQKPYEIIDKYFGVGNTKLYIENMCKFYSRISKTNFTIIRHSNIYGKYDKYDLSNSHFFGASITKVLKATNKIEVWGNGKEKRNLLHISDLCNFIYFSIKKQNSNFEIFNVGDDKVYSVKQVISKIIKYSKKKIHIFYNKNKPSIKINTSLNIRKAKKLGWMPKVSIDQGIKQTLFERKNEIKK